MLPPRIFFSCYHTKLPFSIRPKAFCYVFLYSAIKKQNKFISIDNFIISGYILDMSNTDKDIQEIFPRLKNAGDTHLTLKNWYLEVFDGNFTMDFHTHPQYEIMYCERGQFDFVYKKDKSSGISETVTVTNNCFILINNGYYHRIGNMHDSTKILNLEFLPVESSVQEETKSSQLLKRFILPLKKLYTLSPRLEKIMSMDQDFYIFLDNNNIVGTMREILRKTEEINADERNLNIALLINKLFLDIAHCSSPIGYKKTGILYVDSAMAYINSNFFKKISVKEIAEISGVTDVYLQKMFKTQYGKSIHQIVNEKRIAQAKYLLERSNATMNIIASRCGFGSCEHMTYAFKSIEGCSPSEYRKKSSSKAIKYFSHQGEIKLYTKKPKQPQP